MWLGIVAIAVIAIILLILILLSIPLRYRIFADNEHICIKGSWLFGILSKKYEINFSKFIESNIETKDKEKNSDDEKDENFIEDTIKNTENVEKNLEMKDNESTKFSERGAKEETKENNSFKEKSEKITFMDKLSFATKNGTVRIVLKSLKKLLYISKPYEMNVSGKIGLGDPSDTGILAGAAYAIFPDFAVEIDWKYLEKVFELKANCKGSVMPLKAIWIIGIAFISKPVREFLSYTRGKTDE